MPSIGNIVVKRIIEHKLLPPVYEAITKGPTFALEQWQAIRHLIPPSLLGAGGESPKPHKEVFKFITQSVTISAGTVNRVKVSGVVGISYTQTSFTFESYTIAPGVVAIKTLSDTLTITEPLTVRRSKSRRLAPEIDLAELSHTMSVRRTKGRAIPDTTIISESVSASVTTQTQQTLTETTLLTELLTKLKESKRLHVDTVSESGSVNRTLPGITKTVSESVSVSDGLTFEVTHVGGINITKTLSDSIDLSETITRQSTTVRTVLESIALADNVVQLIITVRSYSNSFSLTSYTSSFRPRRTITETVQESHTVRMALTKRRSVPLQSVNITEAVSAIVTRGRAADIVPVSDEVERFVGRSKVLGDTVIISDLLTLTQADIVTLSDQVTRVVTRNRGLSQSVTIVG